MRPAAAEDPCGGDIHCAPVPAHRHTQEGRAVGPALPFDLAVNPRRFSDGVAEISETFQPRIFTLFGFAPVTRQRVLPPASTASTAVAKAARYSSIAPENSTRTHSTRRWSAAVPSFGRRASARSAPARKVAGASDSAAAASQNRPFNVLLPSPG